MKTLMQRLFNTLAVIACGFSAYSQAILPSHRSYDVAAPNGWTDNFGTGNITYAGGQVGQAGRLDQTGEYTQVFFAEEPGTVTYYLKGQNSGVAWQGTFTLEESVNGSTYTPLNTLINEQVNYSAFTMFTSTPSPATRYLRFTLTNKISGHNLAIDELTVNTPAAGSEQEINITQNGSNVPSGFSINVGNATTTDFVIQNQGSADELTISGIALSGTDASQFSLSNIPTTVAALSNATFTLTFDGAGSGDKNVVITVSSNDVSEAEYIINVTAVSGTLSSEPAAQATALTFTGVSAWDYEFNFTASDAASYLVLRKEGSAPTTTPVDGTGYTKGEWLGNAQVVYVGSNPTSAINARSVKASTTYHYAVYAFNGSNGFQNYLTTSPTASTVTTLGPNAGTTYNGVDVASTNIVSQLTAAMNPSNYFQIYYSNYIGTILNEYYVKDTAVAGVALNAVECQYSGFNATYPSTFQFTETDFSREHCFPQSWMPTYFNTGFDDSFEVSDLHNLLPVRQTSVNAVRSNYPYGDVATVTSSFLDATYGDNAIGQTVYEPRDASKGDAARSVMYQSVKYNTAQNDFSLPEQINQFTIQYGQNEYVLKQWHFNDLPDNTEIARNEYVRTKQNNRNAFIDNPLYACYIRFGNLTKWAPIVTVNGATLTAVDPGVSYQWSLNGEEIPNAISATYSATQSGNYTVEVKQFEQCPSFTSSQTNVVVNSVGELAEAISLNVYPNPSNGDFRVSVNSVLGGKMQLRLIDIAGKEVYNTTRNISSGNNNIAVDANLAKGIYVLEVLTDNNTQTTRVVVE